MSKGQRKLCDSYYFSVEGKTEKWYLEWLQKSINLSEHIDRRVSFNIKVEKDPCQYVKGLSVLGHVDIWHLSDYESNDPEHAALFIRTMDQMRAAARMGKRVTYHFAYSNLTFELWMILHKIDCRSSQVDRQKYLHWINKAYNEDFQKLDDYKDENQFKRCLEQLSLQNVADAVRRSENIIKQRMDYKDRLEKYKKFEYYKENPSLAVQKIVRQIFDKCGLKVSL